MTMSDPDVTNDGDGRYAWNTGTKLGTEEPEEGASVLQQGEDDVCGDHLRTDPRTQI